ncbi:ATP-binding protein [Ignavibacteriales bacterium]
MKPVAARKHTELKPSAYRWKCNLSTFKFETTEEIEPVEGIIGQERAIKALRLGVGLKASGYNIYIAGLAGTGKASTVRKVLELLVDQKAKLKDYCFVNNFRNPDQPVLLTFPAGMSLKFKYDVNSLTSQLRERIPQVLESEVLNQKRNGVLNKFSAAERELVQNFEAMINKDGLTLAQVQQEDGVRPEIMPVINKKAVMITELENMITKGELTKKKAQEIYAKYSARQQDLLILVKKHVKLSQDLQTEVRELEKSETEGLVLAALTHLRETYKDHKISTWFDSYQKDVLENIPLFKAAQSGGEAFNEQFSVDPFQVYDVNIILDNAGINEVPVVIETAPGMTTLFGNIERISDRKGNFYADFMNIKAGSMLRANGGFLVLRVSHLFEAPGVWKTLKRILTYMELDIQDNHIYYQMAPLSLKPESIPIDLKVILIGNSYIYQYLAEREEDFKKIFKVKAEFDYEVDKTKDILIEYAHIIKKIIREENLREFHKSAIASVMEIAARYAGSKLKLTSRFSMLADVVREASFWAGEDGSTKVRSEHVREAYQNARERHSLWEEKYSEMIENERILLEFSGKSVGQVNGLAVYGNELVAFGKPVRISSAAAPGNGVIINVEKESGLSGKTHDKAILIITGFLRETFSHLVPLSVAATIVFEQSYGNIDGDSASIAEVAVILSAISKLPIDQGIAVTGSINQKGDIQPIGGVNEKIEGFYKACKAKGFTKHQGVIIPASNVDDLMLDEEIQQAAKEGNFHIYPVVGIKDALEILFGVKAGDKTEDGHYHKNTIYGITADQLKKMYHFAKDPFKLSKHPKTETKDATPTV